VNALLAEIETELQQEKERKSKYARLEKEVAEKKSLLEARKAILDQQRLIEERVNNDRKLVEKQRADVQRVEAELDQQTKNLQERRREQAEYYQRLADEDEVNREVDAWENARASLAEWEKLAANFHQFQSQRQAPQLIIERERSRLESELKCPAQKRSRDQITGNLSIRAAAAGGGINGACHHSKRKNCAPPRYRNRNS